MKCLQADDSLVRQAKVSKTSDATNAKQSDNWVKLCGARDLHREIGSDTTVEGDPAISVRFFVRSTRAHRKGPLMVCQPDRRDGTTLWSGAGCRGGAIKVYTPQSSISGQGLRAGILFLRFWDFLGLCEAPGCGQAAAAPGRGKLGRASSPNHQCWASLPHTNLRLALPLAYLCGNANSSEKHVYKLRQRCQTAGKETMQGKQSSVLQYGELVHVSTSPKICCTNLWEITKLKC